MKKFIVVFVLVIFLTILSVYYQKDCIQEDISLIKKNYPHASLIRNINIEAENETISYSQGRIFLFEIQSWFSHSEIYEAYLPSKNQSGYLAKCTFKIKKGKVEKYMYDADVSFN